MCVPGAVGPHASNEPPWNSRSTSEEKIRWQGSIKFTWDVQRLGWIHFRMVFMIARRNRLPCRRIWAIKSLGIQIESRGCQEWDRLVDGKKRTHRDQLHPGNRQSTSIPRWTQKESIGITVPLMKFLPIPGSLYVKGTTISELWYASSRSTKYSAWLIGLCSYSLSKFEKYQATACWLDYCLHTNLNSCRHTL